MEHTGSKMAAGAAWMVLFKLVERSLGFVSTLILARLLVPADFGLIAMATSFVVLLEMLTAFGLDNALIRIQALGQKHLDTAWTLNALLSVAVAATMAALAIPVARFFGEPALTPVVLALACGSLLQGFENIGVVHFRREMRFDLEFRFQVGKKLMMFCTAVPLAFLLRNYWALVAGIVAGRVGSVALSYAVHTYRPRWSLAAVGELFGFSKWLVLNNMLSFVRERSSDFILGRLSGPRSLGLYNMAYEIANLPTTELVQPVNRAVFPGYAQMAANPETLRRGFTEVLSIIALAALPAGLGIAATSTLATSILLGEKWLESAALIPPLAAFGLLMALQTNSLSAYLAIGRPDLPVKINAVFGVVLVTLMVWLARSFGAMGAAWAAVLSAALLMPVNYAILLRKLELGAGAVLKVVWRPILAGAGMYAAVATFCAWTGVSGSTVRDLLYLLSAVALGAAVYVAAVSALWLLAGRPAGAERILLDRLQTRGAQSAAPR
jgi:lipopolysaccharide exporter